MKERRKDYMDLEKLYDSVDSIKTKQTEIATDITYIKTAIDRHNHLIDGNGKKGCVDRLTTIENVAVELMESTKRRFSGVYWMFAISVTVLIACFELVWRVIK